MTSDATPAPGTGDPAERTRESADEVHRLRAMANALNSAVADGAGEPLRMLQAVADAAPDLVFVKDLQGRYVFLNAAAARVKGAPVPDVLGRDDTNFFDPEFAARLMATDREIMTSGVAREVEEKPVVEGELRTFLSLKAPYRDAAGTVIGMIGISRDITEARRAAAELARAEARWQFAITSAGDGIWDWDLATGSVFYSPQWKAMLGYAGRESEVGDGTAEWERRVHPADLDDALSRVNRHLRGLSDEFSFEHRMRTRAGTWISVLARGRVIERAADGAPLRLVGMQTDITRQVADRRRAERQAVEAGRLAEIDDLTGIANRRGFGRALDLALRAAAEEGGLVHLALIDVDSFKRYNDTHGHTAGDDVLRAVAAAIAAVPERPGEVAARYGGDELALLLVGDRDLVAVLEAVRGVVLELGLVRDGLPVTVSIGGVSATAATTAAGLLLHEADRRLYRAKAGGRNRVVAG
ncbi:sensor domain-containing diguanylate cyclase [Tsukamurella tyrosinosolvens]|uniref:sensor domain-containing diguanylate cyclase n=1 Tax=Tsukamurella tyrosinosolvens TaxID=57704 RepID=UPI000DF6DEE4|nr:diguanylate cyclase [Tsukamurella tyrosinosolvens]RDB45764.1 diguanylate cyclase [Tsukamurella tyrosinosolvens]